MSNYRRDRREALVAAAIWVAAAAITLGVSYWIDPAEAIGGVPRWVVFGVFVPWIACFAVHAWFTLRFMSDDE